MPPNGAPRIFRFLLPARDWGASRRFYETLLGTAGRSVAEGRVYFDAGSVILGILDRSKEGEGAFGAPTEAVYIATEALEEIHRRARALGCLSTELLHGDSASPMGEIRVRPWGERSFYAEDPSGNSLCFVDAETLFTGTPDQIERLGRSV